MADPQQESAFMQIINGASAMGWDVMIPESDDVQYIIVGQREVIDDLMDRLSAPAETTLQHNAEADSAREGMTR